MSHFCHAEPVEACRDIKYLHSPFDGLRVTVVDGLRVTVVTFYEFISFGLFSNWPDILELNIDINCFFSLSDYFHVVKKPPLHNKNLKPKTQNFCSLNS